MRKSKWFFSISILYVWLFCVSCPAQDESLGQEYTVGSQDVIEITVLEHPDMHNTVIVGQDGRISFPLIGSVRVDGLTATQIKEKIEKLMGKDYIVNPEVTVFIKESKSKLIYVYGEVTRPGSFAFTEGMTVLRAISVSGGLTKYASGSNVKILRWQNSKYEPIRVNLDKILRADKNAEDVALSPGDIIIVSGGIL